VQPGIICEGREVTLSVLSIGPVQWYKWYYSTTGATGTWTQLSSTGPTHVIASAAQNHKGYYKVEIYNGLCQLESQVHIIDVLPPAETPTITGSNIICAGGSIVLTAHTSEENSPLFQWYKNGAAMTGSNSATYTVTSAGSYTVDVTPYQACPSDLSNVHVVVEQELSQPVISPASATICEGSSVTLTATPHITTAIYVWYRNGSQVHTSNTSNTYEAAQAGTYTVSIGLTGCTSVLSSGVPLTVNPTVTSSVAISAGTTGFEVCEDAVSEIVFTATPTNGGTDPSYVWTINGTQVGVGATYTLTNLKQYRPTATINCTMTSSGVACLSSPTVADEKNIRISSCVIPVNPHIRGRVRN
jgi:hypothetical protein